jgi:hypothetical protein
VPRRRVNFSFADHNECAEEVCKEAAKHWSGFCRPSFRKVRKLVQWVEREFNAGYTDPDELYARAKNSSELGEQFGSIWLLLLGNLLISLIVLWIRKKWDI